MYNSNDYVKLFFDMEFTGLRKDTTPISIGIVSELGDEFYFEFTDYDKSQVDAWIETNVIKNLLNDPRMMGDKNKCLLYLNKYLSKFDKIEIWSDCLSYDWVLFQSLFGTTSFDMPANIYYIPFDICVLLKMRGYDPDITRDIFSNIQGNKHNSLYDAKVIREWYFKLVRE